MRRSKIIGLGAVCMCCFLLGSIANQLRLADVMMATATTYQDAMTALDTVETWNTASQLLLPWMTSDNMASTTSIFPSPPACTADQLEVIYSRLPDFNENCANPKSPWVNDCPITIETGCPQTTWLEGYYVSQHQQNTKNQPFLAINVGCNKGYDAVNFLRMGSNNPEFSRQTWRDALPSNTQPANCGQDQESLMTVTSHSTETRALVYCIEPMPSTFLALQNASRVTGWDDQLKVLRLAMNDEDPSTVPFPKPMPDNLGFEKHTIGGGCDKAPNECIQVETKRLDLMIHEEQLTNQRVNVLLIDVEGFDFEVLKGGNSTLRNTEYVEFEFNWRGKVRSIWQFNASMYLINSSELRV